MVINYTPTTTKKSNYPGTHQVFPQEHLTWNYEDPPKCYAPHSQFTLMHYTYPHGPLLVHHPVSHQDCIHTSDLGNKMPHPTNRRKTYGRMQAHEGER